MKLVAIKMWGTEGFLISSPVALSGGKFLRVLSTEGISNKEKKLGVEAGWYLYEASAKAFEKISAKYAVKMI